MSFSADPAAARFESLSASDLAGRLALPHVALFDSVPSTLTVAHAMGPTAASGTLILADEQTAGRGRHGRQWSSAPGAGLWLTLIERPTDARALEVLALRCGLFAAESLDAFAEGPIGVKWPNDLYVNGRKLAGILIETRWRGTAPDWVAIGFGLNVRAPELGTGIGLREGTPRLAALDHLVPALRRAAGASRHLSDDEQARWKQRDIAAGRLVSEPAPGTVRGITPTGELVVVDQSGRQSLHRSGSLTFSS